MSRSEELVQEPMQTWLTAIAPSSRTVFTAPGLCGQAAIGTTAARSISIVSS